ncbi:MAG: GNAT family N-acetyltransferase [Actinobacteria bacterium]|nr:GNAT family N-acetyltransferase [Actinomycetota bacterium]MBV8479935.1 GNAT family N-acetyltransferase [Actinomycetota bacterium]
MELRPSEPVVGDFVRIEPIAERHREGLRAAAAANPEIHRFTMLELDGFDRWFDEALGSPNDVPFVVFYDGAEAGTTRYLNYAPEHRRVEIGWTWLRRSAWGSGANAETKYLLLRRAFDEVGLQRVEFKTDARNLRVRGALLAIGAEFEGVFRRHMLLPTGPRDSAWYAITEDDWPSVRPALERRLAELKTRRDASTPPPR